jgi:hypothetical protein
MASRQQPVDNHLDTDGIRRTIQLARRHEASTGHLRRLLCAQLPHLHKIIQLPKTGALDALLAFVDTYIDHVPEFLDAAAAITAHGEISDCAAPMLAMACDYFVKPRELEGGRAGMHGLLDDAYLAHRLIEEVNDRFMAKTGIPLIPLDMTVANLIVHHLIGEPFANELDDGVQFAVEQLFLRREHFSTPAVRAYVEHHRRNRWADERRRWPCLTDALSIGLHLDS